MHYVKDFDINGVVSRQVACIELHGKPNAATEGALGALGIDVDSPFREVYKCVAVNGSIYTWELLSSGLSTLASTISGNGAELVQFPYDTLKIPAGYLLKTGDLIIDSKGYLYQVSALDNTFCRAAYCKVAFTKGDSGDTPYFGENGNWWIGGVDTGVANVRVAKGSYVGTGQVTYAYNEETDEYEYSLPSDYAITLNFDFRPKLLIVSWKQQKASYGYDEENDESYVEYYYHTYGNCIFVDGTHTGIRTNGSTVSGTHSYADCPASWTDTSISYGTNADKTNGNFANLDDPAITYHYIAIG